MPPILSTGICSCLLTAVAAHTYLLGERGWGMGTGGSQSVGSRLLVHCRGLSQNGHVDGVVQRPCVQHGRDVHHHCLCVFCVFVFEFWSVGPVDKPEQAGSKEQGLIGCSLLVCCSHAYSSVWVWVWVPYTCGHLYVNAPPHWMLGAWCVWSHAIVGSHPRSGHHRTPLMRRQSLKPFYPLVFINLQSMSCSHGVDLPYVFSKYKLFSGSIWCVV